MPTAVVIGTTPLPGLGTPLRDVPGNVQVYTAADWAAQHQDELSAALDRNAGISLNSGQGNRFQSEVDFRGFAASPLLGTPQGLSVFQDGVRVNEPFGDVVNWDFIPQSAISSIQLIPGSNPLFGLNSLGGVLAIYTKSGSQYPGAALEASGGSFGRRATEFEYGGKNERFDWYFTGNALDEDGWAEHNASRIGQFFGKLGWQDERTDLDLSFTAADNALEGTQTRPRSFAGNLRQGYTFPDSNRNQLDFLTLKGSHFLDGEVLLGGNLFVRRYRNLNFSSNVNNNFDPVTDPVEAHNDRSLIGQDSWGGGLQLTLPGTLFGRAHKLVLGASADFAAARFTQDEQDARFAADRAALGTSAFARLTAARTTSRTAGAFAADTLHLDERWTLNLSGRYDRTSIRIGDSGGLAPQLNGRHGFGRFNPALGLNFNPNPRLTGYAAYSEGMRAPTAIELTCADPATPCRLPNNFLADPALKKVLSRTVELGARGAWDSASHWSAAAYRSELFDDIQFVSSGGAVNAGFFRNVGRTLRQGLELAFDTRHGAWGLAARYSRVDARFETPFSENSPANPSADAAGDIRVGRGARIPGIPEHSLKLRVDRGFGERFSAAANLILSSGVFARGDENNANARVPGYGIVNLDAEFQATRQLKIFARVDNLFDRRYAGFGTLAQNFFTGPGQSFGPASGKAPVAEQFLAWGAPRGAWVGLRYEIE